MAFKQYPEETVYYNPSERRKIEKFLSTYKGRLKPIKNGRFNYWVLKGNVWHLLAERYLYLPFLRSGQVRWKYPEYNIFTLRCGNGVLSERDYFITTQKKAPFDKRVTPPVGQMAKWHPEGVCRICYTMWQREYGMREHLKKKREHMKSVLARRKRQKELENDEE